jgi:hypothetical protein
MLTKQSKNIKEHPSTHDLGLLRIKQRNNSNSKWKMDVEAGEMINEVNLPSNSV